ncbi:MAG: high frequency lysogenization protein HflD [Ectothiorhodospiraceae bacterium]|nr:high frequency lysogenization protein HflD [Ectothiorhodospiraceae bacterium]
MSGVSRIESQTLALAALFQALREVKHVAHSGRAEQDVVVTCITGLLRPYDGDVAHAYGGAAALLPGLHQLHRQLSQPADMELTRYAVVIFHLERKLLRQKALLDTLGRGLGQARAQAEYFHIAHENVLGRLADLYSETVSTLKPRIMVQGQREWLDDSRNANLIRALLLAAVRAATLWRSSGGSRFRLIFHRNRLLQTTHELINRLETAA